MCIRFHTFGVTAERVIIAKRLNANAKTNLSEKENCKWNAESILVENEGHIVWSHATHSIWNPSVTKHRNDERVNQTRHFFLITYVIFSSSTFHHFRSSSSLRDSPELTLSTHFRLSSRVIAFPLRPRDSIFSPLSLPLLSARFSSFRLFPRSSTRRRLFLSQHPLHASLVALEPSLSR